MKSLDEVIKKIEKQWVCPSSDEADEYCELYDVRDDALHYLKEYRDDRKNFSEAISNCGKALNKYIMDIHILAQQEENLPLTWDELKQMGGKAVWIEGTHHKHWCIIKGIARKDLSEMEYITLAYLNNKNRIVTYDRRKGNFDVTWQAYRKERE